MPSGQWIGHLTQAVLSRILKRRQVISAILAAPAILASHGFSRSSQSRHGFYPDVEQRFRIRGGWKFGSNSVADLRSVQENGTPAVEMDFMVTADGRLIAAHDDKDIVPEGMRIAALPSSYPFQNRRGQPGAFLEDILDAMTPDGVLFIDLKASREWRDEHIISAANAIVERNLQDRTIIGIYTILDRTADELFEKRVRISMKSDRRLVGMNAELFALRMDRSRCSGICLPSHVMSHRFLALSKDLGISPILPIWSKFDDAAPVIAQARRDGVKHFIVPYPERLDSIPS